jgi:hypothetical protein
MAECKFCNVQPAVIYGVPTVWGRADLCQRCAEGVDRVSRRRGSPAVERAARRTKSPRYLPGQLCFSFYLSTETDDPGMVVRFQ